MSGGNIAKKIKKIKKIKKSGKLHSSMRSQNKRD